MSSARMGSLSDSFFDARGTPFLGVAVTALVVLWLGKGVLLSFVGLPLAAQVLQVLGLLYLWEMAQAALGRDVHRLTVPPTWVRFAAPPPPDDDDDDVLEPK